MWGLLVTAVLAGPPASPLDRYRTPPVPVQVGDPFSWSAEPVVATVGRATTAQLRLAVPPGTRIYRDAVEVRALGTYGFTIGAVVLPPGKLVDDGEGGVREGYDADVVLTIPLTATRAGSFTLRLDVHHQGCRTGLCYPPVDDTLSVPVTATVR